MTPIGFTTKLDAVVHIGAGACLEIDDHRATGAKRIILVEANPVAAAELRGRFAGDSRVEVFEKAVAGKAGERQLHIFNLASASSLHQPSGLKELFPGLRLEQELGVKAEAASAFVNSLGLSDADRNGLLIDAPGEELAILKKLAAADRLTFFEQVIVKTARDALYESGASMEAALQVFDDGQYTISVLSEDPDQPVIIATLNALYKQNRALESELAQAREKVTQLEDRLQDELFRKEKFDAELSKAEVQLDLIKEIFVRDKGF